MDTLPFKSIGISEFGKKNFVGGGKDKPVINATPEAFVKFVNDDLASMLGGHRVVDAKSMPFCKYLFIANFTDAHPAHLRIDNSNAQWLSSGYEARTEKELPVLVRWFNLPCKPAPSNLLMIILYSREQLLKEADTVEMTLVPDDDWSIVSVIPVNDYVVPPMPPITMMRNALGVAYGGNGVPLDAAEYAFAVDYWQNHAMVR